MAGERNRVIQFREELEGLWRRWDECMAGVRSKWWSKRYGKDWVFADVPYHMHYFDRVMVLDPIEKGRDLPEEERWSLLTLRQMNDWNAREFAKRPAGFTPQQSIALWQEMRQRYRALTDRMTDSDLEARRGTTSSARGGARPPTPSPAACSTPTASSVNSARARAAWT